MEETRAQLAAAMDVMDKAPFAEVIALDNGVKKQGELVFSVKVDVWKNRVRDGREPYRTLPGDIIVISDNRPVTASDLNRAGWNWTLASVVNISDDEDDDANISTNFKVKMHTDLLYKTEKYEGFHVVFLENITTQKRIWNALGMKKNMKIIDTVLYTSADVSDIVDLLVY